ncbi:MAG: methyl-accepting chemotaxis sensory transducer [Chlamydiales bacterium]|nr:methyl-accepting chemotaxis sensory transducer [Chlamydiales bacterium]
MSMVIISVLTREVTERSDKTLARQIQQEVFVAQSQLQAAYEIIEQIYRETNDMEKLSVAYGDEIKNGVEIIEGIVKKYYQQAIAGSLSVEEAKKIALDEIRNLRYKEKEYFWIHSTDLSMIMHPFAPKESKPTWYEPQGLAVIKDPQGKALFSEMTQVATQKGRGFVDYYWPKPGAIGAKPVHKLSYINYFQPWGWIIGTGIYLDEIELRAQAEAKAFADRIVFNEDAYLSICNTKYQMLVSRAYPSEKYPDWYQDNGLLNIVDPKGKSVFRDCIGIAQSKGEGLTESYTLTAKKSDGSYHTEDRKAYAKLFGPWNWVLMSEVHLDKVEKEAQENHESLVKLKISILLTFLICGLIGCFICTLVTIKVVNKNLGSVNLIKEVLDNVAKGILNIRVNAKDEIASYFNDFLNNFEKLVRQVQHSVKVMGQPITVLENNSKLSSNVSNQQAAGVKEIVSTMEDTDQLAKRIANKVEEVSGIATLTKTNAEQGYVTIKNNLQKMEEVKESNQRAIEGIRTLSGQINSIWDIVKIINGIADQTKIIAFNAELEASAAGEAGKNFQIVATEIRRLADNTVSSTMAIRKKIQEIQHSSDVLIISAEESSLRVNEGYEGSLKIGTKFGEILKSSEASAISSQEIVASIQQQVAAFEQILLTLRQLSDGINSFADSSKLIAKTSGELKQTSEVLADIAKKYQ